MSGVPMCLLLGCSAQQYRRCSTSLLPSEITMGFYVFPRQMVMRGQFLHIPQMQIVSYSLKELLLSNKGERSSNIREEQPSEAGLLLICLYFHSNL